MGAPVLLSAFQQLSEGLGRLNDMHMVHRCVSNRVFDTSSVKLEVFSSSYACPPSSTMCVRWHLNHSHRLRCAFLFAYACGGCSTSLPSKSQDVFL